MENIGVSFLRKKKNLEYKLILYNMTDFSIEMNSITLLGKHMQIILKDFYFSQKLLFNFVKL